MVIHKGILMTWLPAAYKMKWPKVHLFHHLQGKCVEVSLFYCNMTTNL
jgi:hypothetical protein